MESFRDHSKFLNESDRYKFLFSYDIRDYRQWAYGLKKAGYATNPQYPQMLIKIIEDYNLDELDKYYKSGNPRHGWSLFAGLKHAPIETSRTVEKRNGRNALFSKNGDTFEEIATEFALSEDEIFQYNDCSKGSEPEPNTVIYLQAKKRKAPRGNDYHVAKENESLWSIAQWYGVRMKSIRRYNNLKPGEEPHPGQVIALRHKLRGAE
jgi:LysM repeat protein